MKSNDKRTKLNLEEKDCFPDQSDSIFVTLLHLYLFCDRSFSLKWQINREVFSKHAFSEGFADRVPGENKPYKIRVISR